MQPWRRAWARYFTWLQRQAHAPRRHRHARTLAAHERQLARVAGHLSFWSETGLERNHLLTKTEELLEEEGWKFSLDTGWTNWDLHVFASRWWNLRLRSMTEIYPHGRRLSRVGNFMNVSTFSSLTGAILGTFAIVTMLYRPYEILPIAVRAARFARCHLVAARPAPAPPARRTGGGGRDPRRVAAGGKESGPFRLTESTWPRRPVMRFREHEPKRAGNGGALQNAGSLHLGEIMEELRFLAAVREGMADLDKGLEIDHEEVKKKLASWLSS